MRRLALAASCLAACASDPAPERLPRSLPFELGRTSLGEPVPDADRVSFSQRLSAFWLQTTYFEWIESVSHGMHKDTGMPDYLVWWQDIEADGAGDTVTFQSASGGAHNIFIPTPKILSQAASGYLLTGDPAMGRLVEQYSKGIVSAFTGMMWDENDPNPFLMARNIVTHAHTYTLADGRKKAVRYDRWYDTYEEWNAQRIHFPHNPTYGDIYVTNMRSKDDVPHIFSAATYLEYIVEDAPDGPPREAAAEALRYLKGFAKDIVDSGYRIRTKDAAGQAYVPDQDLASFVTYESLIPDGECNAKLSAALLGYGDSRGNDCRRGGSPEYEAFATATHYFNYAIVQHFHVSAVLGSLMSGENDKARRLLAGLIDRMERYADPDSGEPGRTETRWAGDLAVLLVQAAAAGYPLTHDEVRHVHAEYAKALALYEAFPHWNLWDSSHPDGLYEKRGGYRPDDRPHDIADYEMATFLMYCFSPFRNPAGAPLVDCDALTATWKR